MKDGNYFEADVSRTDFYHVKLSSEFREYLSSLTPEKERVSALDYDRSYDDMHILIEVMSGIYATYLKDYNFGYIKPLGECIYELNCKSELLDYECYLYEVILPDLSKRISNGEIDMDKELYDYYHILPDAYIPFIDSKISDYVTVGEAAKILGVSDSRIKKMVADRVLDGFKQDGRIYLSKLDVEQRKDYIEKYGKPTKSSLKNSDDSIHMNIEYEQILNIPSNEQFIKTCFKRIQLLDISEEDFTALTDKDVANEVIKDRNRYSYPIIIEVPAVGDITNDITHIKNARRYYSDRFLYREKHYLLCNDWYYPTPGKKNTKDNRTPFIKWIQRMELKYS